MFKKLRNYFLSGILILAPLFLTVLVLLYLVRLADGFVVNPVFQVLPLEQLDVQSRIVVAKLIIALAVMLFVTLLGLMAQRFLFRRILGGFEGVILGIPVFNMVYRSFKEIAQAIFGEKTGIFKRVVFVEYPRKGILAMGFVTYERPWVLTDVTGKDLVSVFIPTPPNPATGYFIFVPREELVDAGVSVEEGVKLCVSIGAAAPQTRTP